ncbi:hypothetical protein [Pilimelia columellifera]|uniref:Uncharacterized protein n=1 Tax=Pilimelia columellifera subsp. columellifera TaxID=706583 RepID=A0ABN3N389_9ACTN
MDRQRFTRRAALAAAAGAVVGLSGCGLLDGEPEPDPAQDPLHPLLVETTALVASYDAALASRPSAPLTVIRDTHAEHARALAELIGAPAPSPRPPGAPTPPPGTATLRAAERRAQDSAATACLAAPASRATLLGEIAAARASHGGALR